MEKDGEINQDEKFVCSLIHFHRDQNAPKK